MSEELEQLEQKLQKCNEGMKRIRNRKRNLQKLKAEQLLAVQDDVVAGLYSENWRLRETNVQLSKTLAKKNRKIVKLA
jgi:hypothetical protein